MRSRHTRNPKQQRGLGIGLGVVGFALFAGGLSCLIVSIVLEISGLIGAAISMMVPGFLFLIMGVRSCLASNRPAPNNADAGLTITTATTSGGFQQSYTTTGNAYGFQQQQYPTSHAGQLPGAPPPYSSYGGYSTTVPPPPVYTQAT